MIELKFTGMCKDCVCADLEVSCLEVERYTGGIRKIWEVHCIHSTACDKMESKILNQKLMEE